MDAVEQIAVDPQTLPVIFARDQPEYAPLPALAYPDGTILIEWSFSEEERARIARGENLRHWVWLPRSVRCPHCHQDAPALFAPVKLEITNEHQG